MSVLVAGIGNIFLGDDGFGVEVAQRLSTAGVPPWVRVADFGIRGLHLAFELIERDYETTILVDATPRGGAPGTLYLIEPDRSPASPEVAVSLDAHGMSPDVVLSLLTSLGGAGGRIVVVGCEPENVDEGIGLSTAVSDSLDEAVRLVRQQIEEAARVAETEQQDVSRNPRADRPVH